MQNLGHMSGINAFQPVAAEVEGGSASGDPTNTNEKEANRGWILNPTLDYLFVCGGLMWMLYGLTLLGVDGNGPTPTAKVYGTILYWGSLIFSDAHGPASMVRVFGSDTTPKRVRYIVIGWAVVLIGVSCVSVFNRPVAEAFVAITRLWAIQHYISQTFGISLIYCMKRGYKLNSFERLVLQTLMRTMMYFIFVRFFTIPEYGHVENFMGMNLPFYGPLPSIYMFCCQFAFTFSVLVFTALIVCRLFLKGQLFPLPALVAIFSIAAVTLSPRNGFYLLGVSFLHGSQYVAVTLSYYLRERSLAKTGEIPQNILPKLLSKWTLMWFAIITALGYLGSVAMPMFWIRVGLPDALVLCTVYGLHSCHHFLTDAFIWRIRDPKVRSLLV
jgi:hypothetical protein